MSPRSPSSVVASRVQQIEANLLQVKNEHGNAKSLDNRHGFGASRSNVNNFLQSPETKPTASEEEESLRRRVIYFDLDMDQIEDTAKSIVSCVKDGDDDEEEGDGLGNLLDQILLGQKTQYKREGSTELTVDSTTPIMGERLDTANNSSPEDDLRRRVIFFDMDPEKIPDLDQLQLMQNIPICGSQGNLAMGRHDSDEDMLDQQSTIPTGVTSNVTPDYRATVNTAVEMVLTVSPVESIETQGNACSTLNNVEIPIHDGSSDDSAHQKPTSPTSAVMTRIQQIESSLSQQMTVYRSISRSDGYGKVDATVHLKEENDNHTPIAFSLSDGTSNLLDMASTTSQPELSEVQTIETIGLEEHVHLQVIVMDHVEETTTPFVTCTNAELAGENHDLATPLLLVSPMDSTTPITETVPDSGDKREDVDINASPNDDLRRRVIFFDMDPEKIPDLDQLQLFHWNANDENTQETIYSSGPPGSTRSDSHDIDCQDPQSTGQTAVNTTMKGSESVTLEEQGSPIISPASSIDKQVVPSYSLLHCPGSFDDLSHDNQNPKASYEPWDFCHNSNGSSALNGILDALRSNQGLWLHNFSKDQEEEDGVSKDDPSTINSILDDDSKFSGRSKASVRHETSISSVLDAIRSHCTRRDHYEECEDGNENTSKVSESDNNEKHVHIDFQESHSGLKPIHFMDSIKKLSSRYDDDYSPSDIESDDDCCICNVGKNKISDSSSEKDVDRKGPPSLDNSQKFHILLSDHTHSRSGEHQDTPPLQGTCALIEGVLIQDESNEGKSDEVFTGKMDDDEGENQSNGLTEKAGCEPIVDNGWTKESTPDSCTESNTDGQVQPKTVTVTHDPTTISPNSSMDVQEKVNVRSLAAKFDKIPNQKSKHY